MKKIYSYFIIEEDKLDGLKILKKLEKIGRTCYKSEEKTTKESAEKFIKSIIEKGHDSILEHESISVRIVCDRGISHEIVRHRLASYSQESTRYCNYTKNKFGNEITVIEPLFWQSPKEKEKYEVWKKAMQSSEEAYMKLLELGAKPQAARSVLPNSLKTELVISANLREWRHIFKLRTSSKAHPQIVEIMKPLLEAFKTFIPVIFDDIGNHLQK